LQALFVPVLYNIALISHPVHSLYSIIGDNKPVRIGAAIPDGEQVYKIKSPATNFEMIPQLTRSGNMLNVFVGNQVPEAGNYQLVDNNKVISGLSFNYNRNESNLECFPVSELETMLNKAHLKKFSLVEPGQRPLNEVITQMNSGTQLWRYFVWLALAMLLGEILLIRFFKK
jgi:hypothetical protein